jgi:hypothetical protein
MVQAGSGIFMEIWDSLFENVFFVFKRIKRRCCMGL